MSELRNDNSYRSFRRASLTGLAVLGLFLFLIWLFAALPHCGAKSYFSTAEISLSPDGTGTLVFGAAGSQKGTQISHVPGTAEIVLHGGTYRVLFTSSVEPPDGAFPVPVVFLMDGAPVDGVKSTGVSLPEKQRYNLTVQVTVTVPEDTVSILTIVSEKPAQKIPSPSVVSVVQLD